MGADSGRIGDSDEITVDVVERPFHGALFHINGTYYEVISVQMVTRECNRVTLRRRKEPVDVVTLFAQSSVWLKRISKEKPYCARCKKRVDDVFAENDMATMSIAFCVHCHGSVERFSIPWNTIQHINEGERVECFMAEAIRIDMEKALDGKERP